MLQQTRVETVIPYYQRWMDRFPTLEDLARAEQDEILNCWEGLGYYHRATNLHQAAKEVVSDYGGNLPDDPEILQQLPGIGRYTAGAISSIAFNQVAPILDGIPVDTASLGLSTTFIPEDESLKVIIDLYNLIHHTEFLEKVLPYFGLEQEPPLIQFFPAVDTAYILGGCRTPEIICRNMISTNERDSLVIEPGENTEFFYYDICDHCFCNYVFYIATNFQRQDYGRFW